MPDINKLRNPYVLATIEARLLASLAILFFPFVGTVIFTLIDIVDSTIFVGLGDFSYKQYHQLDKILDFIGTVCMLVISLNFPSPIREVVILLFLYRLVGLLIFIKTLNNRIFLLFPNFFQTFFTGIVFLVYANYDQPYSIQAHQGLFLALVVFQIGAEVYIHYLFPKYLKNYKVTNWTEVFCLKDGKAKLRLP